MSSRVDTWLEARVKPPKGLAKTTLILCRTKASAGAVRRWIARRGGMPGVDVATPAGLALQTWQPPLLGELAPPTSLEAELPPGAEIGLRIGDRPGLTALARRHVRALRSAEMAGPTDGVPTWLRELADLGWAVDSNRDAQVQLLERARAGGRELSAGYGWDRVALVGFDLGDDHIDPWTRAVVAALKGRRSPASGPPGTVDAIEVPDVATEARVAAAMCRLGTQPVDETLILVADVATARRVRDALRRNRIPCAWRDTASLQSHALASAVTRCVPWFTEPDPPIRVSDLAWVLGQTSLGRNLHPAAQFHLEKRLEAGGFEVDDARLRRRGVVRTLEKTRLLDAPLSRWILKTEELGDARALAINVRLQVLSCCINGESLDEHFPAPDDAPWDDFDDIVAQLLDDGLPGEAPPPRAHSLGALKAFLVACRVRVHDDPAAVAILGALKRRQDWSALPAYAHEALGGAIDPGLVASGADVMTYDDYDGRPAGLLLLLDVHDKGVARRPSADPLLDAAALRALGVASGRALVDHRIDQAHRARANAERTVAVVTARDAGGRDVVAPIQLDLDYLDDLPELKGAHRQSHGLSLDLPEVADLRTLVGVTGTPQKPDDTDRLAHLARHATAEWFRDGRGLAPPAIDTSPLPPNATLADRLRRGKPLAPQWLMGLLGHSEGVPEAALPDEVEWSQSRLFNPLSHCLYQAWLKAVLRVREPETVTEDFDPREIGNAVHDALEGVGAATSWRAADEDLEAARDGLVGDLRAATATAFDKKREEFGSLSEARLASTEGQVARWNAHWPVYARTRIKRIVTYVNSDGPKFFVQFHPQMHATLTALRTAAPDGPSVADYHLKAWLSWASKEALAGQPLEALPDHILLQSRERTGALPSSWAEVIRLFVGRPVFDRLVRVQRNATVMAEVFKGALEDVAVEVPFGAAEDGGSWTIGEISLLLGTKKTALRGRVDRIAAVATVAGRLLEIADYKTGNFAPSPNAARGGIVSLKDPQLVIYALAVREAIRLGVVPETFADSRVAALGYDHIRRTMFDGPRGRKEIGPLDAFLVDDGQLDHAAATLGWLLDEGREGRWTLAPRGDTCPKLANWGHDYCPYAGACRLRALPPADRGAR